MHALAIPTLGAALRRLQSAMDVPSTRRTHVLAAAAGPPKSKAVPAYVKSEPAGPSADEEQTPRPRLELDRKPTFAPFAPEPKCLHVFSRCCLALLAVMAGMLAGVTEACW